MTGVDGLEGRARDERVGEEGDGIGAWGLGQGSLGEDGS